VNVLNEELFNSEKLYQVTMTIAKSMLSKGMITTEEYAVIDTKMLEKYRPILGTLLSTLP
jgi:hypothetical protein